MKVFLGKARLEEKEIGVNYCEWECIVFALNELGAERKVRDEIKNSPHMKWVSEILDIRIKEVAVIA